MFIPVLGVFLLQDGEWLQLSDGLHGCGGSVVSIPGEGEVTLRSWWAARDASGHAGERS